MLKAKITALGLWGYAGLRTLFDIAGGVDFVITRSTDPGWIAAVGDFIINPPSWFLLLVVFIGFVFFFADRFWQKRNIPTTERKTEKSSAPVTPEFISLRDAAISLYEKSRQGSGILARAAEQFGGPNISAASPDERLDWLAAHLSRHIPIFGKKPPSTRLEKITETDLRSYKFNGGAITLRHFLHDKSIFWADLAVRSSDIKAQTAKLLMEGD